MIEDFASVTQREKADKGKGCENLGDYIQVAKVKKASESLEKYMHSILYFWYYQYLDSFHIHPQTIDDMFMGLRYISMKNEAKDG